MFQGIKAAAVLMTKQIKMQKFITEKTANYTEHWNYCIKNDIPFIRITPAVKYAKVEFDVDCMLEFFVLTGDPSEFLVELYSNYAVFFMLPVDKISCMGGTKNLIFTVYKADAEFIAAQLFDYLTMFVKSNRKSLNENI
jgi:hypothetical protein